MNLNEIKDLLNDIHDVIYEKKSYYDEFYYAEKDRPIGMKKDLWEKLVYAYDELECIISREVTKQEKQFLIA